MTTPNSYKVVYKKNGSYKQLSSSGRVSGKAIVIIVACIVLALVAVLTWRLSGYGDNDIAGTTKALAQLSDSKVVEDKLISAQSDNAFILTSPVIAEDGVMPTSNTCDGAGESVPLSWLNAPTGTKEFAIMMTTIPVDGSTKWSWVLYGVPASITSLAQGETDVGTFGVGSHNSSRAYQPPCSQGPGTKEYTVTIYALSATPELPSDGSDVTGEVLSKAISSIIIDSASITMNHARPDNVAR